MSDEMKTPDAIEKSGLLKKKQGTSRRALLGTLGAVTAAGFVAGSQKQGLGARTAGSPQESEAAPPIQGDLRAREAYLIRQLTAQAEAQVPVAPQQTNGDEQRYPNYIGSHTKGLAHVAPGLVNIGSYQKLLTACARQTGAAFEAVPLAGPNPMFNPMAGVAFELEGLDGHHTVTAPPPELAGAARADEAVELYWMALSRDISFNDYAANPVTKAAAAELSSKPAFIGPRQNGAVTAQTLFRGFTPADAVGPYVSQFLLRPVIFDTFPVGMGQFNVAEPGIDYATDQASWLAMQDGGAPPPTSIQIDPQLRYVRNGRDLASVVHLGGEVGPFTAALNWLTSVGAPLNPGNPYVQRSKQIPLITFGIAQFV